MSSFTQSLLEDGVEVELPAVSRTSSACWMKM